MVTLSPLLHLSSSHVAARLDPTGRTPGLPFLSTLQAHTPGFAPVREHPCGCRKHLGDLTVRHAGGQRAGQQDGIIQHSSVQVLLGMLWLWHQSRSLSR